MHFLQVSVCAFLSYFKSALSIGQHIISRSSGARSVIHLRIRTNLLRLTQLFKYMDMYVKDPSALEEIRKLDYYKTFSNCDEEGKLDTIVAAYERLVTDKTKLTNFGLGISDTEKFVELLPKAVSEDGLLALIGICRGQNMHTWNRGYTLLDMLAEAKILSKKNSDKSYPWHMYSSNLKTLDKYEHNELWENREFAS